MDSVYGSKKYFQSLAGGSDAFRGPSCRALSNDYSYTNTMGRHSPIGPYMHMKQSSYSTDMSVASQYGYNTWGTMNNVRNMTPAMYNTRRRNKMRSFSIILTTAALIVLLAILSIGGLAFYFSGFKPNPEDALMMFKGSFRIQKGDQFTSALRSNNTSIYRQKTDFYKRFIERSLLDNDVQLSKVDILGFGDGPLIEVQFVTTLDMRNIPKNVHNVEDHIRNSLFLETNSLRSLYKFLRIEPDSVHVVRVTGENMARISSSLPTQDPISRQSIFEKKLSKTSSRNNEKAPPKFFTTSPPKIHKNDGEPEVDVENAPVIQGSFEGSFEITKTDADITAKKTTSTKSYSPYSKVTTASIGLRSKTKKTKVDATTTTTPMPTTFTTEPATTPATTTTTTTTTTPPTTTVSTTTTTTTNVAPTEINTQTATPEDSSNNDSLLKIAENTESTLDVSVPPKLEMSLFTSAPVLDTKPWHPIQPSSEHYTGKNPSRPEKPIITFNVAPPGQMEPGLYPRNKVKLSGLHTEAPSQSIFYQSFTSPVFMSETTGIEKLGNTDVKPYPIPVPLIDDVVAPNVKPVLPMHKYTNNLNYSFETEPTLLPPKPATSTALPETVTPPMKGEHIVAVKETRPSPRPEYSLSSEIGEVLLDLLQLSDNDTTNDKLEQRTTEDEEDETEKPLFLNIKDLVLNKTKASESQSKKPGVLNDIILFPTQTKYEYMDSEAASETSQRSPLKKTYNNTLQALIVENQDMSNRTMELSHIKRNSSENLENITIIFDTLSSKLGIVPTFPTKELPFSTSSQQKMKQDQSNIANQRRATKPTQLPLTTTSTTTTTTSTTTTTTIATTLAPIEVEKKLVGTSTDTPSQSTEQDSILGEAEVEVVDPTKYEEMLSSQAALTSTTTSLPPTLVTLLPVRSNSGIRTVRHGDTLPSEGGRAFSDSSSVYREAVVTSGIKVST